MLCSRSTAYSSPVMNVEKVSMPPGPGDDPFAVRPGQYDDLPVAGRTLTRRRTPVSPRRGSRQACHRSPCTSIPGQCEAGYPERSSATPRSHRIPPDNGNTAPRPTPGGCRSFPMRSWARRCCMLSPRSSSSASANLPSVIRCTPSAALRSRSTLPAASSAYARAELVPQSIASRRTSSMPDAGGGYIGFPRDGRAARDSCRRCYQRAAASSSLARASTQRSPSGVRSFFQKGARVLR